MKRKNLVYLLIFPGLLLCACVGNPNVNEEGQDTLESHEIDTLSIDLKSSETTMIYVPVYSDIYVDHQNQKAMLAATLSIRNTSFTDTLIVYKIDYYDTNGKMVRSYLETPIGIPQMATINYVIEKRDDTGGPGANFIVELGGIKSSSHAIVEAVMIGEDGNKAFSFMTEGKLIE